MRYALLIAALAAALAAPSALAGSGTPVPEKRALPPLGEPVTTLVSGPTQLAPGEVPAAARTAIGKAAGIAANCGACIVTCWSATTRNGPSDWSGHVYIFQYLRWCGNGAAVTYAQASQGYEQAGWYVINGTGGPWWSGGCLGCSNIRASGYILWDWRTPLVSVHHSGTTNLDTTIWAYGGISF